MTTHWFEPFQFSFGILLHYFCMAKSILPIAATIKDAIVVHILWEKFLYMSFLNLF